MATPSTTILTLASLGALVTLLAYQKSEIKKNKRVIHHFDEKFDKKQHPEIPDITPIDHPSLTIRIIVPAGSSGTDFDARLYQKLLKDAVIVYLDQESIETYKGPSRGEHYDVNFFIERVLGRNLFPSTWSWLMVNQEMLRVKTEPIDSMDLVICKTRYAQNLMSEYLGIGKVRYLGHSSKDLGPPNEKDYSLAIHPAGKSWLKGTYRLLKAWIDLDPSAKLVVTCRDMCINPEKVQSILRTYFRYDSVSGTYVYKTHKTSISLSGFLPEDQLQNLQSRAGIWLCPSEVEGYGHYINEGRSAGAVVMTTDFPPMSELIDSKSGFLVKVDRSTRVGQEGQLPGSLRSFPRAKNIKITLGKIFSTSIEDLKNLGTVARKNYDRDLKFLENGMKKIVEEYSTY